MYANRGIEIRKNEIKEKWLPTDVTGFAERTWANNNDEVNSVARVKS
jgi:hypothetical protein